MEISSILQQQIGLFFRHYEGLAGPDYLPSSALMLKTKVSSVASNESEKIYCKQAHTFKITDYQGNNVCQINCCVHSFFSETDIRPKDPVKGSSEQKIKPVVELSTLENPCACWALTMNFNFYDCFTFLELTAQFEGQLISCCESRVVIYTPGKHKVHIKQP